MQDTTVQKLELALDRLQRGDAAARDDLIALAQERLTRLSRKMLNQFARLRQWEQTDDVLQQASMRLYRSLEQITPSNAREFFGLAAQQIRRELLDLTRRHFGRTPGSRPPTPGASPGGDDDTDVHTPEGEDSTHEPGGLAAWAEFHQTVNELPEAEREIIDLLWYQELTQEEAAAVLGVDKSTVKRRWRTLRLKLSKLLENWISPT